MSSIKQNRKVITQPCGPCHARNFVQSSKAGHFWALPHAIYWQYVMQKQYKGIIFIGLAQ